MNSEYKEIQKLLKEIDKNEKKIASLPKGTIFVRKINNKKYVYRNRKINGKVKSEYLGPFYDEKTQEEIKKSRLYKNGVMNIRKLRNELGKISKIQKDNGELTEFAISMNKIDGVEPSKKAKSLLNLLEKGIIDIETYEFAIDRMYQNA